MSLHHGELTISVTTGATSIREGSRQLFYTEQLVCGWEQASIKASLCAIVLFLLFSLLQCLPIGQLPHRHLIDGRLELAANTAIHLHQTRNSRQSTLSKIPRPPPDWSSRDIIPPHLTARISAPPLRTNTSGTHSLKSHKPRAPRRKSNNLSRAEPA